MVTFALDAGLTRSAAPIATLPLCEVLLRDEARWPWLILVPRRAGLQALTDLSEVESAALMTELRAAVRAVAAEPGVDRTNVGQLGNVVAQLHIHVVGRWAGDAVWPGPVWGVEGRTPYDEVTRQGVTKRLLQTLVV